MLIPWSTDAPIYHYPIGTVALIVVNTAIQVVVHHVLGVEEFDPPMVHFGALRPWEWVGANFLHADWSHLIGNMIFLWAFGLVVEGKVGWWRFLLIYLAIGVLGYGLVQVGMLHVHEGGALGASLPIYGLLAIAMVWAPKNDLSFVGWFFIRPVAFDAPIMSVAFGYLGLQLLFYFLGGMRMSSELLHLVGAVFGFPIGVVMLLRNWVDCENWDLFAVWEGRAGQAREEVDVVEPELLAAPAEQQEAKLAEAREHMRRMLAAGHAGAAAQFHHKMLASMHGWRLSQNDLLRLIEILHQQQAWADSVPVLVEYLKRFPERSERVRLRLAQVLVEKLHRPGQALRVLRKIEPYALKEKLAVFHQQLLAKAQQLQEHAPMELEAEDW